MRALAVLLVAFLSLRGAIGLWQQFGTSEASPVAPAAVPDTAWIDGPHLRAPASPAPTVEAVQPPRPAARPPVTTGPVPWQAIESSASFVEGHAGPVVAAFIDLDCGYCSQLWRKVRAPLAAGRLRVRWIPVAVLAPGGAPRAAALLHAADPVAALAARESRGEASPPPPHLGTISEDIAANNALLAALTDGRPATPLLVARGADRVPRATAGVPADLLAFLADAR